MFRTVDRPNHRDGMGKLASIFIDDTYLSMKKACTPAMHQKWANWPMARQHVEYAAKDAYVSYELYKRILAIKNGLDLGRPTQNDFLCVRCKNGEDYKEEYKKRLKTESEERTSTWKNDEEVMPY